jgi:hypothetical protein
MRCKCRSVGRSLSCSFSPHSGGEEARLRGIASRADERPSAVREGRNEEARLRGIASRADERPSAVREGRNEEARLRGIASRAEERPSAVREGRNEEARLRGIAWRADERPSAVREGRTRWRAAPDEGQAATMRTEEPAATFSPCAVLGEG